MKEWQKFGLIVGVFLAACYIPFGHPRVSGAMLEAFAMVQEYARDHVLLCLVPALFIAGAIANFVSQAAVIRYFGRGAPQWLAYSVAAVSGTILAVCSCTVLPLFAGIRKRGAGLGPAVAFMYSGPAINVLAIILTARVLGWRLGVARAAGAVAFSVIIGLIMALLYRREEAEAAGASLAAPTGRAQAAETRSGAKNLLYFAVLVAILVFAAWGRPAEPVGLWNAVFAVKWYIVAALGLTLAYMLARWFRRDELSTWVDATWGFSKQILPLLFLGVLAAGALMGRPGLDLGLVPARWIAVAVGGNSLLANLAAAVAGALMYFATLTEVPILQGLIGAGMGQGPALALLLAGPALSLPSMIVLQAIMGAKKTATYVALVVVMSTLSGMIYGAVVG
jgi:hypothetical protein